MNVAEQEVLFKQVKVRFGGKSSRWCSGYVAGIVDADKDRDPDPDAYDELDDWDYAEGYCSGYLDAVGPDADHLFTGTYADRKDIDYRWWGR